MSSNGMIPTQFELLPDWLTPSQVQGYLGLSRSKVYELLRSGEIPSRKFGRLLRTPKESLRPQI